MKNFEGMGNNLKSKEEPKNPNNIGEVLSVGKDLPASPDKVYRSVKDVAAINDIKESGVVRSKQSAGLENRYGDKVYWSQGANGKYHAIYQGVYVIEAPLSVAKEGIVKKEDITAIYTRNENNEIVDILKQELEKEESADLKI